MMIHEGVTIPYTNPNPAAIAYGAVVDLDTRIGIAAETIAVGATGSLCVEGVHELPANNSLAFSVGEPLYWDPVAGELTSNGVGLTPAGWCTAPKLLAGTTARVKIN